MTDGKSPRQGDRIKGEMMAKTTVNGHKPKVKAAEPGHKVCLSLRHGIHEEVLRICKLENLYASDAYSSGMAAWVAGMSGQALMKPVHQVEHLDLEKILNSGKPEAAAAVRAVMAALLPEE